MRYVFPQVSAALWFFRVMACQSTLPACCVSLGMHSRTAVLSQFKAFENFVTKKIELGGRKRGRSIQTAVKACRVAIPFNSIVDKL